jgi:hypothetical protein
MQSDYMQSLLSISVMFFGFIRVGAGVRISLLFKAEFPIPFQGGTVWFMYYQRVDSWAV